jgi:hypothetical protein
MYQQKEKQQLNIEQEFYRRPEHFFSSPTLHGQNEIIE